MTHLILDATYLCHRAFYAFPELQNAGNATGVLYGFMRDLVQLKETHNTDRFIFCFDYGKSNRYELFDGYKSKRSSTARLNRNTLHEQLYNLRHALLKSLGYSNVFFADGFEADDIIASVVLNTIGKDEAIIVSSDHDMYQLLSERVCMYSPAAKRAYTVVALKKQYGVEPIQWPHVKSIAGCVSDCIPGVAGVGEITAAKYLMGKLSNKLQSYAKIDEFAHSGDRKRNYNLVKLPFPGTPEFKLAEDTVTHEKWRSVCKKYGMKSLLRSSPLIIQDTVKQGFLFDGE